MPFLLLVAINWATPAAPIEHSCFCVGFFEEIHPAPLSFSPMGPPCSFQQAQSHRACAAFSFPLMWLKCTVTELTIRALLLILPSKLHQTKPLSYLENYCQSVTGLNYHFQLAMLSLLQSPCCHMISGHRLISEQELILIGMKLKASNETSRKQVQNKQTQEV